MAKSTIENPAYEFKLTRIRRRAAPAPRVDSPERALKFWQTTVGKASWYCDGKEHLVTLFLNVRNDLEGFNLVSLGSVSETVAHPREILAPVLCAGAYPGRITEIKAPWSEIRASCW